MEGALFAFTAQQSLATIYSILKQYWGYEAFRPLQEEVIQSVLQGKDTLALMPTGGGKSICFQVPALMREGLCLVISPLIALMKDQVEQLRRRGIPALAVYAGMPSKEVEKTFKNALYGNFKFLYLSPERLQTSLFREYAAMLPLNLITVDEAHCISQWGYDFRPAYLKIAEIREVQPDVPILALTATATRDVRIDIQKKLGFRTENLMLRSFARPNLSYSVFSSEAKLNKLVDILRKVPGSSVVYCNSRRHTKEIAALLNASGIQASHYHAGLTAAERSRRQEDWLKNRIRVMVSTNAFGMGIDKPDVRVVVHYEVPECLEAYYQEAGRAGRDEQKAYAVLLYQPHELKKLEARIEIQFPSLEQIRQVYQSLVNYLQIPLGSGEGQYYDFDLTDFAKRFKLNVTLSFHAIRVMEQEGYLCFSENIFLPSRVSFTTNKDTLYQLEQTHPALALLVKTLLRTYEGIFDCYAVISEKQLSRIMKKPLEEIQEGLQTLHRYGLIDYVPQKDRPQLFFLQDRVSAQDLRINLARLAERKQRYQHRISAMIHYVRSAAACRSQLLLDYFDEKESKACGVCDVCLRKKRLPLSATVFEKISRQIVNDLTAGPLSAAVLLEQLRPQKAETIQEVLKFMLDEGMLRMNGLQIELNA